MAGGRHQLVEGDSVGLVEDIRFPAHGINPPGAETDPIRDTSTGLLVFANAVTNVIVGVAQMPHGMKFGTLITPHVHIRAEVGTDPGAGPNNVTSWTFEYKFYNKDEVTPALFSSDPKSFTLPAHSGGQPVNYTGNFTPISSVGKTASSFLEWRISRLGGSDTYGGGVILLEFDVHYYHSSLGTFSS